MSELSDDEIDRLEAMIPKLAAVATNAAYLRAVAAGHSLIMAKDGVLVQIHPDGSEKSFATCAASTGSSLVRLSVWVFEAHLPTRRIHKASAGHSDW